MTDHTGIIDDWDATKAYGFIKVKGGEGERVFVHKSNLVEQRHMLVGEHVTFRLGKGRDGREQAIDVRTTQ